METSAAPPPPALDMQRRQSAARQLIIKCVLLAAGATVFLAFVPQDAIAPSWSLAASMGAALVLIAIAAAITASHMASLRGWMAPLFIATAVKLAAGLWYWDTFLFGLDDQAIRPTFTMSEVYNERASDTAVIDELLQLFKTDGLQYFTSSDADLSINNRPPAHFAAIVVRAFGGRYAAYFPFMAFLAFVAGLALLAAVDSQEREPRGGRMGYWLAILWPMSWLFCNTMKDGALFVAATVCCCYLSVASKGGGTGWGIALASLALPPFRVVYVVSCAVLTLVWIVRSGNRAGVKVFTVVAVGAVLFFVLPILDVEVQVTGYRTMTPLDSTLMGVPVLGRVVLGLMTPFPWTQAFEVWWKYPYVFLSATSVLTGACLVAIFDGVFVRKIRDLDYGALLALTMMMIGILANDVQPAYVQVGSAGLLPIALRRARNMGRLVMVVFLIMLLGNVVWIALR